MVPNRLTLTNMYITCTKYTAYTVYNYTKPSFSNIEEKFCYSGKSHASANTNAFDEGSMDSKVLTGCANQQQNWYQQNTCGTAIAKYLHKKKKVAL